MVLASLMGVVMFGNLHEKTKEQADFVVPVYQAMALSTYQQHLAAERGYMDVMRYNDNTAKDYINDFHNNGIVQLAVAENNNLAGNASLLAHVRRNLPEMYKPQNGTRSYLFCMTSTQTAQQCNLADATVVKYIVTLRPLPAKYSGGAKMTALRAIADATGGSRFVGMLKENQNGVYNGDSSSDSVQPRGAKYYILSGGNSPASSVYIPNHITCKFPLNSTGTSTLGAALTNDDYLIAVTRIDGTWNNATSAGSWPCS